MQEKLKGTRLRRRKLKLFNEDPHCFWCRKEVIINQPKRGDNWDNSATIDHLDSKLRSLKHVELENGCRTVLCCKKCNHNRNKKEQYLYGYRKRGIPRLIRIIRKFYKETFIYGKPNTKGWLDKNMVTDGTR